MKTYFLLSLIAISAFAPAIKTPAAYVWAWADNTYGQTNVPSGLTNPVAIAISPRNDMVLSSDGRVAVWGDNYAGQTNVPANLTNVVAIAAGAGFCVALKADGSVTSWGDNTYGEVNVPPNLSGVVNVFSGGAVSFALKSDGTIVGWGDNSIAGVGHLQLNIPAGLTNVTAMSIGSGFCLALQSNGTVVAWGDNALGECDVPADLTNAVAVAAGDSHSLALRADGTVVAWGDKLQIWGGKELVVPTDLTHAVAVAAGYFTSMALKSDGTVEAWGGLGYDVSTPPGLSGVTAIATAGVPSTFLALGGLPQPKINIAFIAPLSRTVAAGAQAFFSVNAFGAPPLTYQWYFGINAIPGATNRWLSLSNVQVSQAGSYTVKVSNLEGSATSQPVMLNVMPSVQIDMVPAITLKGGVSSTWEISYVNAVGPTNAWTTLATVTLTNTQQFYFDVSAIGQPARFYRLVQGP